MSALSKNKRIAITGSIGSGKSTAAAYLRSKGLTVYDCDAVNRRLLEKGEVGYHAVGAHFPSVLAPDQTIDRQKLATVVFNDPCALAKLNALLHPLILADMLKAMQGQALFIAEVPLLFETEFQNYFDHKLLISTEEDIALSRLLKRGISTEEAERRLAQQLPLERKKALADTVIENNGDLKAFYKALDTWLKRMNLC